MNAIQRSCVERIIQTDLLVYSSDMETAAVLYGPTGSGKTYVMSQALIQYPKINPSESECCLNLIVCNYAGVSHSKRNLENASRLITIRSKADVSNLNISTNDNLPITVLSTNRQMTLLLEALRGFRFQRIILDAPEILAPGYTRNVVTHVKWFITCQKTSIMHPHRFRRRSHLFVLPPSSRIVTLEATVNYQAPNLILYRETNPHLACITVNMMLQQGEVMRARTFLPCYNIRKCDTEYVYGDRVRQKLEETCPICYE